MSEALQKADIIGLAQAASESLTDNMVERLSITGANTMEIIDRLNDEDTRDAINSLIDKLTEMHRSGGLDTLFDVVSLIHGARSAVTDNMVERLASFIEHMVNNLANEEMADLAHNARNAMEEAVAETAAKGKPGGGLISTISMLRKPETQQALQFMLTFACKMKQGAAGEDD